ICTYNPHIYIYQRLLNAVLQFDECNVTHEVIIVDNNSLYSLSDNENVKLFLKQKKNSKLVIQVKQGLTAARISGIELAKNDWVIFFDDDNEPAQDYLVKAAEVIEQHPQVGAWGPGNVEVEYVDGNNTWLEKQKGMFQQRNSKNIQFDRQQQWQECYPFGTGLIIKKNIAAEYAKRIMDGRYTLSDRKGKSLSSGGDVQMVLTCIQMGHAAGVANEIFMHHLIQASKVKFSYMLKLMYSTASAYIKAYNQVFVNDTIKVSGATDLLILKQALFHCKKYLKEGNGRSVMLALANKLGQINAAYVSDEQMRKPFLLTLFEKAFL
ncbi:MAG: glycosyltransferase, partial [Ferruginibacter sp.]